MLIIPSIATSLYFITLLLSVDGQLRGYIQHNEHKLIHPAGNAACDETLESGTKLVIREGGLGMASPYHIFEFNGGDDPYGYIKHQCSGKYVHPSAEVDADNDTELVYNDGKCYECLFKFEPLSRSGFIIVQKYTEKIWYPKSGQSLPEDNTAVVLRRVASQFVNGDIPDTENGWFPLPNSGVEFAKFSFVDKSGSTIAISPLRYIIHRDSGMLVYPHEGLANPLDNTTLVTYAYDMGDERSQLTYMLSSGHIMHMSSGKFVVPRSKQDDPPMDDPLVFSAEKHSSGKFKIEGNYILHASSDRVWSPHNVSREGIPDVGGPIVLTDKIKEGTRKFRFVNANGDRISPI